MKRYFFRRLFREFYLGTHPFTSLFGVSFLLILVGLIISGLQVLSVIGGFIVFVYSAALFVWWRTAW